MYRLQSQHYEKDLFDVTIAENLEGLIVDSTIYVTSHENDFPRGDLLFWLAVADQIADLLEETGSYSADLAALLAAESYRKRVGLLARMTNGRAAEFLQRAQDAIESEVEDEDEDDMTILILPSHGSANTDISDIPAETPNVVSTSSSSDNADEADDHAMLKTSNPELQAHFTATEAPFSRETSRKRFVVVKSSSSCREGANTQLVDENETLEIVEFFERYLGRHPIRVSNIRGYDGPRCDVVSLGSVELRNAAIENAKIDLRSVCVSLR